jgi:Synergist-CTERM protein sorting domain-containing protein
MKMVVVLLLVVVFAAFGGAAYAAGHDDIVVTPVAPTVVSSTIATAVGGSPAAIGVGQTASEIGSVKAAVASIFPNVSIEDIKIAPLPLLSGSEGSNVVEINPSDFDDAADSDVHLYYRASNGDLTEISYDDSPSTSGVSVYGVTIARNKYVFASDNGGETSPVATDETPYLVLNLVDGASYDLDNATGNVEVAPEFVFVNDDDGLNFGDDDSSGGCNAGFAPMALLALVAGGYAVKFGKKD